MQILMRPSREDPRNSSGDDPVVPCTLLRPVPRPRTLTIGIRLKPVTIWPNPVTGAQIPISFPMPAWQSDPVTALNETGPLRRSDGRSASWSSSTRSVTDRVCASHSRSPSGEHAGAYRVGVDGATDP